MSNGGSKGVARICGHDIHFGIPIEQDRVQALTAGRTLG
jgi:hypothetical protein